MGSLRHCLGEWGTGNILSSRLRESPSNGKRALHPKGLDSLGCACLCHEIFILCGILDCFSYLVFPPPLVLYPPVFLSRPTLFRELWEKRGKNPEGVFNFVLRSTSPLAILLTKSLLGSCDSMNIYSKLQGCSISLAPSIPAEIQGLV